MENSCYLLVYGCLESRPRRHWPPSAATLIWMPYAHHIEVIKGPLRATVAGSFVKYIIKGRTSRLDVEAVRGRSVPNNRWIAAQTRTSGGEQKTKEEQKRRHKRHDSGGGGCYHE